MSGPSFYFIYIPRLLAGSLPIAIYGAWFVGFGGGKGRAALEEMLVACVGLVAGGTAVGHKEWRFIVYGVIWAGVVAGVGADRL